MVHETQVRARACVVAMAVHDELCIPALNHVPVLSEKAGWPDILLSSPISLLSRIFGCVEGVHRVNYRSRIQEKKKFLKTLRAHECV